MGHTFSVPKLKVALKTAVARMSMQSNKLTNNQSILRRTIAQLLGQKKDESARIKVESLLATQNLLTVYETLSLMCDLLVQRIAVISQCKEVPDDLEEAIATLIYASSRVEIEELTIIANQFAGKFGEKFAVCHLNNEANKVNPRIVSKLRIEAPSFDSVLTLMSEIAAQHQIVWEPDMVAIESGINSNDPQQLGSIGGGYRKQDFQADDSKEHSNNQSNNPPHNQLNSQSNNQSSSQSNNQAEDPFYPQKFKSVPETSVNHSQSSSQSNSHSISTPTYPGTLDVIVLRARQLVDPNDSNADIVVRLTDPSTGLTWKSQPGQFISQSANNRFTNQFEWSHQHWPLAVLKPTNQLVVEVLAINPHAVDPTSSEQVLGGISIEADQLRTSQGVGTWYHLFSPSTHLNAGQILLAAQFMSLSKVDVEKAQVYGQPNNQSISQSNNKSNSQASNQSSNQSASQSSDQSNNQSSNQSNNQATDAIATSTKPAGYWVPSDATPPPAYDSPTLGSLLHQSSNQRNVQPISQPSSQPASQPNDGWTDPGTGVGAEGAEGQSVYEPADSPDADLEARFRALNR